MVERVTYRSSFYGWGKQGWTLLQGRGSDCFLHTIFYKLWSSSHKSVKKEWCFGLLLWLSLIPSS